MKIEPVYVTFEQAELLKEKRFDIWCEFRYTDFNGQIKLAKDASELFPLAPEQWQVVEWLRINHGIWVGVSLFNKKYKYLINQIEDTWCFNDKKGDKFNTPQQAYSAAFDYVLKELM